MTVHLAIVWNMEAIKPQKTSNGTLKQIESFLKEGHMAILNRILKPHIDKRSRRLRWLAKNVCDRDKCHTPCRHLPSRNAPHGRGGNKIMTTVSLWPRRHLGARDRTNSSVPYHSCRGGRVTWIKGQYRHSATKAEDHKTSRRHTHTHYIFFCILVVGCTSKKLLIILTRDN